MRRRPAAVKWGPGSEEVGAAHQEPSLDLFDRIAAWLAPCSTLGRLASAPGDRGGREAHPLRHHTVPGATRCHRKKVPMDLGERTTTTAVLVMAGGPFAPGLC